jgi:hypothetical protein
VIGLHLVENGSIKRVFGLDSFQGFDASVGRDLEPGGADDREKRVGGFESTSLAYVQRKLVRLGLAQRVTLLSSYFVETLELLPETRYGFVHLDCDIYMNLIGRPWLISIHECRLAGLSCLTSTTTRRGRAAIWQLTIS